ncbi:MAG: RlmE family RNA methyltransferase [Candidatus Thermoplasmatota archaeon]
MGSRWLRERRADPYYKRAKREHYASRAAYKLMQIDNRFRLIYPGNVVLDLGAAPGGWTQVAAERSQPGGLVIAVDMRPAAVGRGAVAIRGEVSSPHTLDKIRAALASHGKAKADVVVSDMSPSISGIYGIDHARSADLVVKAMEICDLLLRPKGRFAAKVFEGEMMSSVIEKAERRFGTVKLFSPDASRDRSSEIYLVGKGFRGGQVSCPSGSRA